MQFKAVCLATRKECDAYDKAGAVEAAKERRSEYVGVNSRVTGYKEKYYRAVWAPSAEAASGWDWRVFKDEVSYLSYFNEERPKSFWDRNI